jgi:anti-anti-sigma regulatory factor
MLRIQERSDGEGSVTFSLSGRIESKHVDELRRLLETERGNISLDLEEVKLVDCDAVRFLSSCEARGIELRNCPPYVHNWILGVQSSEEDTSPSG